MVEANTTLDKAKMANDLLELLNGSVTGELSEEEITQQIIAAFTKAAEADKNAAASDITTSAASSAAASKGKKGPNKGRPAAGARPAVSTKRPGVGARPAVSPKRPTAKATMNTRPAKKTYPYEFTNAQQRARALCGVPDFRTKDPCLQKMIQNINTIEAPKLVNTRNDWLETQRENGQSITLYQQGGPNISWSSARCKTIYLYIIDESISEEQSARLVKYCQAWYHGMPVKLLRPGQTISVKDRAKTIKKKLPVDFVSTHQIETRMNPFPSNHQMHAGQILQNLKQYKNAETFCILAVTNVDIYPRDEWNFVFGLASMEDGCGIFSFARHQEHEMFGYYDDGASEEEKERRWFERSCSTMVHEIGHMFGLKHCIYYECTMNGSNGSFENTSRSLCTICLTKLKLNAKFDCKARFEALIEVASEFGWADQVEKYQRILQL